MSDFSFRCELDDRELQQQLKKLDRSVGIEVLKKAARAGARPILNEAKARVPVDSGELRGSLGLRQKTGYAWVDVSVVARAPHAHLVEFGTAPHRVGKGSDSRKLFGKKRGRLHPGAKPQPFMRPAFDNKAAEAVAKVGEVLRRKIQSVAK
jgi:HK97 gp10 family phage protein